MRDHEQLAASLFERMTFIRCFEERVLALFSEGKLSGTTHVCLGQEAIAVAVADHLDPEDIVFSPHRCHGHFLAQGGAPDALIAEMMGREDGVCGGRGGSQHLHMGRFFSNGVQGGIVGNAAGAALAQSLGASPGITVVFLGDGTLGEGLVYETLNFAALRRLPILFVVENNRYAQTTPTESAVSGSMKARAEAFGIAASETDDRDPLALYTEIGVRIGGVRSERSPYFLVVHTYRLGPHSKGDDFRPEEERAVYRNSDPLAALRSRLAPEDADICLQRALKRVDEAVARAEASPLAQTLPVRNEEETLVAEGLTAPWAENDTLFVHALNRSLHALMKERDDVVLIGQDILDPYGGAFSVYKGISAAYPDRVIGTPISEAGLTAWGIGAALLGLHPICEIMFGDFLLLAADQIVNHAVKYPWVSDGSAPVPLVIRVPMGAGRGYGPTHSQTLESMFLGVPGLRIIAPCLLLDPGEILRRCVAFAEGPVLFVENKLLYPRSLMAVRGGRCGAFYVRTGEGLFPTLHCSLTDFSPPDVCLFAYGGMATTALAAAERLLLEHEIAVDVIIPSQLSPTPAHDLNAMSSRGALLATVEEGTCRGGWGAEIAATRCASGSVKRLLRIGTPPTPPPAAASLEKLWLPDVERIVREIVNAMHPAPGAAGYDQGEARP